MKHPRSPLKSWTRPHYQTGGGEAFLLYVVYGRVDADAAVSRSVYRTEGIPDGLSIMSYGPTVHPEAANSFRSGYLWDQLKVTEPELAARISAQDSCLVLQGTIKDSATLDYLRDTIGLITHFLDNGGVAVFDPQMFKWWTPESWKERVFAPDGPVPRNHTAILVSEDGPGTEWIHTRGLRKFGRPDLSIHRVEPSNKDGVIDLCNRFIEFQAFGGVVSDGQEIRMASLPQGMRCRHRGNFEDPDFNNVHLEIAPEPIGEPSGPANASQPMRLETNGTPSPAGPRR